MRLAQLAASGGAVVAPALAGAPSLAAAARLLTASILGTRSLHAGAPRQRSDEGGSPPGPPPKQELPRQAVSGPRHAVSR